MLERLLADGWSSCGPTDAWDLEKDGTHILLATELGEMGYKCTRIRIEGDASYDFAAAATKPTPTH